MTRLVLVAIVTAACAAGGTAAEARTNADCLQPTLTIVEPKAGTTVAAPFRVRYRVRCFRVGATGGYLQAYLNPQRRGIRFEFKLRKAEGAVAFPDHPMVSGRRAVLFELAWRDHSRVRLATARVVVPLTIEGSRTP